jgi:hypothetical protein
VVYQNVLPWLKVSYVLVLRDPAEIGVLPLGGLASEVVPLSASWLSQRLLLATALCTARLMRCPCDACSDASFDDDVRGAVCCTCGSRILEQTSSRARARSAHTAPPIPPISHNKISRHGCLQEVLTGASIAKKIADTKAAKEMAALEEFFSMLSHDSSRAFYGPGHVIAAAQQGAIGKLLISDALYKCARHRCMFHEITPTDRCLPVLRAGVTWCDLVRC